MSYGSELEETISSYESDKYLEQLSPNTAYSLTLTIITHGGESITSEAVTVTTMDGGEL